jgi:hypothetical protein
MQLKRIPRRAGCSGMPPLIRTTGRLTYMSQSFTAETWEPVCRGTAGDTWRMRVAGGWIYRYDTWTQDGNGKVSSRHSAMVFVPDPTERQKAAPRADRR